MPVWFSVAAIEELRHALPTKLPSGANSPIQGYPPLCGVAWSRETHGIAGRDYRRRLLPIISEGVSRAKRSRMVGATSKILRACSSPLGCLAI